MLPNSSKIEVLDSLRAFAALSVCLFHFICTTINFLETNAFYGAFENLRYGVQMFFVISGFVIPWAMFHNGYKLKNIFSFFLKRFVRLEPPYIFSILLILLVLFVRKQFFNMNNGHVNVSIQQVMLHFGYLIPFFKDFQWLNIVYWTLAIEFQYYILIALLFIPLIKFNILFRSFVYLAIIFLSNFCSDDYLFYWLPIFLLGILLFLYKSKKILILEFGLVLTLLLAFCVYKYPFAIVVYSTIPIVFVIFKQDLKILGLHALGKFSYSIYLIHPVLGSALINLLSHHFTSTASKFMLVLFGILFTIFCAWITYIFIEKPSKKLSASIKYKN